MRIWSFLEKYQEAVLEGHTSTVISVVITSDNEFIVSDSYDRTIRLWNFQDKF